MNIEDPLSMVPDDEGAAQSAARCYLLLSLSFG